MEHFCACWIVAFLLISFTVLHVHGESATKLESENVLEVANARNRRQAPTVPLPRNFKLDRVKSTSFRARWTPSKRGITGNYIAIQEVGGDYQQEAALRPITRHVLLTDLKPETTYRVQVKSVNGALSSGTLVLTTTTRAEKKKPIGKVSDAIDSGSSAPGNGSTPSTGSQAVGAPGTKKLNPETQPRPSTHDPSTFNSAGFSHDEFVPTGNDGGGVVQDCKKVQKTDLVILIDGSWSVGPHNFVIMQDFLVSVVKAFKIGYDGVLVGIAQYSDDPRTEFQLNDHVTKEDLVQAIRNIEYKGGNTATGRALDYLREAMYVRSAGARADVEETAIIITDGESILDSVSEPARRLRESGVTVFSIGVAGALRSELKDIASQPSEHFVYSVEHFDDIKNIKDILLKDVCKSVAVCRPLVAPQYGSMYCDRESTVQGTNCTFQCRGPLYKLQGGSPTFTLQCLKKAEWNGSEPICVPAICNQLEPPPDGRFPCTNGDRVGSVCTLRCREGFNAVGDIQPQCQPNAEWTSRNAMCELITCPEINAPTSGGVSCTIDNEYSSVCTFTCDRGYRMQGSKRTTCGASGSWSNDVPNCILITCSALKPLENGNTVCSDSAKYGSECDFTCDVGYELLGSDAATCGGVGQWSLAQQNEFPLCQRIRCNDQVLSDHVSKTCTDGLNYGSECNFECDEGYELLGAQSSLCGGSKTPGTWSERSPICSIINCPALKTPPNGQIQCSDGRKFGSRCNLKCDDGYELQDTSLVTCAADESWTGSLSACQRITCGKVDSIANGVVQCTDGQFYESKCTYTCDVGYQLTSGSRVRLCQANREFDGAPGVCSIKQCFAIVPPLNGKVECTDSNNYGSVCRFTCNIGFELDVAEPANGAQRRCGADLAWSNEQPTCRPVRCGTLAPPDNGNVRCSDQDNFGSICQFQCNIGHEMEGSSERLCQETKSWTGVTTTCNVIRCGQLSAPANGEVSCAGPNELDLSQDQSDIFGSSCTFTCDEGYYLTGPNVKSCRKDKAWSGGDVACERITCPFLTVPLHSKMACTQENEYGSDCSVTCDRGYFLASGNDVRTCQSTFTWSGKEAVCQIKTCDNLGSRDHLTVTCTNGNRFGSICTYQPELGYELDSTNVIMCDDLLGNEPPFPFRMECPVLDTPENGVVTCTDDQFFDSTCNFVCNEGYKLVGSPARTCQGDKTWTGTAAACQLITCPAMEAPEFGSVDCSSDYNYNSECSFSCDEGYDRVGPATRTCLINRAWSGQKVTCVLVSCPLLDAPGNGKAQCSDENNFNSRCSFECNDGYQLSGSRSRVCRADHAWSGKMSSCVLVTCPELTDPKNGRKKCSDGQNFASECRFICEIGYELNGSTTRTCQSSGEWSGDDTSCNLVVCPSLAVPRNGSKRCQDGNNFDSTCRFLCDVGFELIGSISRTCRETGVWSGAEAQCQTISCGHLIAPEHGEMDCTNRDIFNSKCSFTCEDGHVLSGSETRICSDARAWTGTAASCTVVKCPDIHAPSHGRKKCTNEDRYDSTCEYVCEVGYDLVGSQVRVCQVDGTWTGSSTSCVPVSCDALPLPENGKKRCSDGESFESDCRFSCNTGYDLFGSHSRTCQENGQWSGPPTSCQLITCDELNAPEHGAISCTQKNIYDSECSITCEDGYERRGSPKRLCQLDKQWSGVETSCNLIACPELRTPVNGEMTCVNGNQVRSDCVFRCNAGYDIVGSEVRTCLATQSWSGLETSCATITCGALGGVANGVMNCDGNSFNSVCTFKCNEGYAMSGSVKRKCKSNRSWSGKRTSCSSIICPTLPTPSNGRKICTDGDNFESDCRFICNVGFELSGSRSRSCQSDESWSGNPAFCDLITCSSLPVPANGNKRCSAENNFDSKCRFQCNEGYEMVGSKSRKCNEDGEWSGSDTACELIRCDVLEDIDSGSVDCTQEDAYGSVCKYTCQPGYNLMGTASRTCQEDGAWNGAEPSCQIIRCGVLQPPQDGEVSCTKSDTYHSQCTFTCNDGFQMSGSLLRICGLNGSWSGSEAVCSRIKCPDLDLPSSARLECSDGLFYGSKCLLVASDGYEIDGEPSRICGPDMIRGWSAPVQIKVVNCSALTAPPNGRMRCSNQFFFNSNCEFTCNYGYELVEDSPRTCQSDRTWSGNEVSCSAIKCGPVTAPLNGEVFCNKEFYLGSRCTFTCLDGYELAGSPQRTCGEDRQWDEPQPICVGTICGAIDAPTQGSISCSEGDGYNSVCTFACGEGYRLQGSESRTCLGRGVWSGVKASCTLIRCGPLEAPVHGNVDCTDNDLYESECTLTCNSGFTLVGSYTRQCSATGVWGNSQPACVLVACPKLFNPANGVATCSNSNNFNSVCRISCDDGYQLIGSSTRVCQDDAQFSGSEAVCSRISCPELDNIDHGDYRCVDEFRFNSLCTYICNRGYNLVGTSNRKCLSSGDWSNSPPSCERVTCRDLRAPTHGSIQCTASSSFESVCTVTCDSCYQLSGARSRSCRSDGRWSGEIATCQVSICYPLRAPRNGAIDCGDSVDECGTTCVFTCNAGYRLEGDSARTCDEGLQWTGDAAECVRNRCPPLNIGDGIAMECTNDTNIGSNCTFTCNGDGVLLGSTYRECLKDGTWSKSNPVCRTCKTAVTDVLFIIDGSWSVGTIAFQRVKDFLKALVEPFQVGWDNSRFGVIQYSDDPRVEFYMNDYFTVTEVLDAIESIPYKGGNTNTGHALSFGLLNALSPTNGARPYISKVALVLTDGRSQDEVGNPARELRQAGVKMLAVGVGDADVNELRQIASPPYEDTVYHVVDYDSINEIQAALSARLCESDAPRDNMCGCPAGPPGPPGQSGRPGTPGQSVKGTKGDPFSVVHVNYEDQTITARNGDGSEVNVPLPANLAMQNDGQGRAFFPLPGPPGPPGKDGSPGTPGVAGEAGPQGPRGEQGPEGAPGVEGPEGPLGAAGPPGPAGRTPTSNGLSSRDKNELVQRSEDVAKRSAEMEVRKWLERGNLADAPYSRNPRQLRTGPPGPPGPPGSSGLRGRPGMQGFEGPRGPQGPPGVTGPKGSQGQKGSLGDKGAKGPPGIGVTGAPGTPGKPGPKGERGIGKPGRKGPRGPAGKSGKTINRRKASKKKVQ